MNILDLNILLGSAGLSFLTRGRTPLFVIDGENASILAANERACQFYGYTGGEFRSMLASDLCAPEDVPHWMAQLSHSDDSIYAARSLRHRKRAGESVFVDGTFYRSEIEGCPVIVVILHDVTASRLAETAMVRREARFRSVVQNTSALQFIIESRGDIRFMNARAEQLLGNNVGRNFFDLLDAASTPFFRTVFQSGKEIRDGKYFQHRIRRSESAWFHCESSVSRITMGADVQCFLIESRDVTEQVHREEKLKLAEEAVRRLNIGLTIWESDQWTDARTVRLLMANETAEHFACVPLRAFIGKTLEETLPKLLRTGVPDRILHLARLGQSADLGELQCDSDSPNEFYSIKAFPLSPTTIGVIFEDSTERRSMELRARRSEAMELVGQVAAGVAHHFNNILTVVDLHVGLLARELPCSEEDYAGKIKKAVQRAAAITRQLLAFSTQQSMKREDLDLKALVHRVTCDFGKANHDSPPVELTIPDDLPQVSGDRLMLELALLNILENGRDFMPEGGKLVVQAEVVDVDADYVRSHPESSAGSFVRLAVSDTGSGIAPEVLPYIFNPFFTTKDVGEGAGLGLATAYGIVKQHHGWIDVKTTVGQGSEFQIFLPHPVKLDNLLPERKPDAMTAPKKETILLVEDELEVRLVLGKILQTQGYPVLDAATGVEALEVWKENHERIDLLLTDIIMPGGVTGWELAEKLRAQKPELKVVFTSGYSKEMMRAETSQPVGSILLQKPYSPDTLLLAVANALSGSGDPPAQKHV